MSVVDFFSSKAGEFAEAYQTDSDFRDRLNLWSQILTECIPNTKVAFDMGCGPGLFSFFLASKGVSVVGVDAAEGMIDLCEKRKKVEGYTNCSFVKATLPGLPANLGKAQLILSSSLLEYIPEFEQTISVFRDHLEPGGRLVFSLPNRQSLYRKLERLAFAITGKPEYYRWVKNVLSREECVQLMERLGFRCERIEFYAHANMVSRLGSAILPRERTENLFLGVFRKV
jgi:2-polyprenyl-3-methyl-5-hydroxy-6-metoxy-1,4-benzoquinol methylase